ncbi:MULTISPECIES: HD-GYP domain-containing protein [unclassified Coleofasciculus]|uniref:HD-GYP domain-containing protein n=1 Tax=unclassified Coleofasciculus TaxID=2692782 RepID=UPI00187E3DD1|nr:MULTISPECIES: HD domain-containing phosphohydrolase [unclassified Coleofasciculus]MBE9128750.1 HD domain-containing protein [Coleofasciculus sp. LEGE 07081]MBE9150852.1 HD domain-containing protein [Coleofasciculus sp. LEGE 07092]
MLYPGDAEILNFLEQIQLARNVTAGLRCYRLRTMCLHFGRWLELDKIQLRQLVFLSYCHGLGKIGIPDSILLNPGSLTEQDWAKIREYPETSALICKQLPVLREFAPLVRSHQERLNGTGYPDKLQGDEIPFIVQVFQLVNVADAIISKRLLHRSRNDRASERPYWIQAVEEIRKEVESGARDSELCEKFFRFLELFYQGGG